MKKGFRKIFIAIFSLCWGTLMGWIFKNHTSVLVPLFTFGGTIVTGLFAANWAEHREENKNVPL